MFHVPAFNTDSLFKSQTRTRAQRLSFPDERHKHAQTHTWISGAPSLSYGGNAAAGGGATS